MHTVATFPSREAALYRWGRPTPATSPVLPPQEWIDGYLSGFGVVADLDKGVDADADAWPNCAAFWWVGLDDAGRAIRVENPYKGENDGMDDAERLNNA
ncbi:hypothetical protein [Aquabacterium sp.]|uniref:hypothetical protein n=1 Tax=Aquabacterium sp. TaxID=1872578 RepID=UPI0035B02A4E